MQAFVFAAALSLFTIIGDYCVKMGSLHRSVYLWWLIPGAFIYAATAFGWYGVFLQKMKFSTAAVVYSLIIIIFHVLLSVLYFKEKINSMEIIGILLAVISLVILARFA